MIVNALAFLKPLRGVVDKVQTLMGWPVIILGVICLVFWSLGAWFRKIANQSADFCERVVEAQFATHTKSLKSRRRDQDAAVPQPSGSSTPSCCSAPPTTGPCPSPIAVTTMRQRARRTHLFENRELAFLRNVRLLYQDYLDGSPLHRSDTKASVQLLGNLALTNLRRSHLGHLLREGRTIDRLDLSRSGGLFGGPYLWFNYITRMLVQETALLILDYNRHAVPLDRLACSPRAGPPEVSQTGWPAGSRSIPARSGCPSSGERAVSPNGSSARRKGHADRRAAGDRTVALRQLGPPGSRGVPRDGRVHRGRLSGRRPRARRRDPRAVRPAGRRAGPARPPAERPPRLPQLPAPRAAA